MRGSGTLPGRLDSASQSLSHFVTLGRLQLLLDCFAVPPVCICDPKVPWGRPGLRRPRPATPAVLSVGSVGRHCQAAVRLAPAEVQPERKPVFVKLGVCLLSWRLRLFFTVLVENHRPRCRVRPWTTGHPAPPACGCLGACAARGPRPSRSVGCHRAHVQDARPARCWVASAQAAVCPGSRLFPCGEVLKSRFGFWTSRWMAPVFCFSLCWFRRPAFIP